MNKEIEWPDESRINAIGQNGNTGEHYEVVEDKEEKEE
tara:strand:- start:41 stop:154 length:114 start_codon:yes stop_codon:yes gene_type:complete